MLNKLKIIFIAMTISSFAYAECRDQYKTSIKREFITAARMTVQGSSLMNLAALPLYIGLVIVAGEPVSGISMIGSALTTIGSGSYTVGQGVSVTVKGVSLLQSYQLINQAEVGFGNALSNLTEDLSDALDREVMEDEVADIINLGNQSRDFCQDAYRKPYSKKEVFHYVKEIL